MFELIIPVVLLGISLWNGRYAFALLVGATSLFLYNVSCGRQIVPYQPQQTVKRPRRSQQLRPPKTIRAGRHPLQLFEFTEISSESNHKIMVQESNKSDSVINQQQNSNGETDLDKQQIVTVEQDVIKQQQIVLVEQDVIKQQQNSNDKPQNAVNDYPKNIQSTIEPENQQLENADLESNESQKTDQPSLDPQNSQITIFHSYEIDDFYQVDPNNN